MVEKGIKKNPFRLKWDCTFMTVKEQVTNHFMVGFLY